MTGSGESALLTERSARFGIPTVVVVVAMLFELSGSSGPLEPTSEVLVMIVPAVTPGSTWTTSVDREFSVFDMPVTKQLIVPVPPTGGVSQDHESSASSETNVVPVGISSKRPTRNAESGPL